MPQFVNILGSSRFGMAFDPSVLIEQALPDRSGAMLTGAECPGSPNGCPSSWAPMPPGEGIHGIEDIYLCC
jgi:hypothetical protein